jgi:serine/threonine protein kinase
LKTLHGLGVCHRNINFDTILVVSSLNNTNSNVSGNDIGMCALVSGLESCRPIAVAERSPSVNQTPQCVPPEVWKGTIETTTTSIRSLSKEQEGKEPIKQVQHGRAHSPTDDDLWAAGVLLSVLLLKAPLFDAPLATDAAYQNILRGTATAAATTDDDATTTRFPLSNNAALDLLRAMLAEQPEDRLTLEQIWHHEWLRRKPLLSPPTSSSPSSSE